MHLKILPWFREQDSAEIAVQQYEKTLVDHFKSN
jgi:hypothetical protein